MVVEASNQLGCYWQCWNRWPQWGHMRFAALKSHIISSVHQKPSWAAVNLSDVLCAAALTPKNAKERKLNQLKTCLFPPVFRSCITQCTRAQHLHPCCFRALLHWQNQHKCSWILHTLCWVWKKWREEGIFLQIGFFISDRVTFCYYKYKSNNNIYRPEQ